MEAEDILNKGLTYNANDPNLLSLLKIAEPKVRAGMGIHFWAKIQREEQINQLPPLERHKASGNEFFKASKFPEAINEVRAFVGSND